MKKSFLIIFLLTLVFLPFTVTRAQFGDALNNLNEAVGENSGTGLSSDFAGSISTVVKGILALVGTIFFLLTIYAGILWMTARGDDKKVEKAVDIIRASIIGLIITLSAYAITFFITSRLGAGSSGGGSGATMGCCIGTEDKTICSANVRSGSCSDKATWSAGNCPDTCKIK